jgi:3-hydroxy acid dehydrogenase/malonic semialdehyde reductase
MRYLESDSFVVNFFRSITGASAGIGRDTAVLLARAGTSLVLTARRIEQLDKTKQLCLEANKNVKVEIIAFDVSSPEEIKNILDKIPSDLRDGG